MPKVYCLPCNEIHDFDDKEAEELIWALQAEAAENLVSRAIDRKIYEKDTVFDVMRCLKESVAENTDIYLYGEHFQVMRQKRDEAERVARCEEKGVSTCPEGCLCCSGEYCNTHINDPCECDTLDRHAAPERDKEEV